MDCSCHVHTHTFCIHFRLPEASYLIALCIIHAPRLRTHLHIPKHSWVHVLFIVALQRGYVALNFFGFLADGLHARFYVKKDCRNNTRKFSVVEFLS